MQELRISKRDSRGVPRSADGENKRVFFCNPAMHYESEARRKMYTTCTYIHTHMTFAHASSQLPVTLYVSIGIARIAILTPLLHQSSIVSAEKLIELWFRPVTRISGHTPSGDWFTLVFITTRTRRRGIFFFTISAIAPCSERARTIASRTIKISDTESFSNKNCFP